MTITVAMVRTLYRNGSVYASDVYIRQMSCQWVTNSLTFTTVLWLFTVVMVRTLCTEMQVYVSHEVIYKNKIINSSSELSWLRHYMYTI